MAEEDTENGFYRAAVAAGSSGITYENSSIDVWPGSPERMINVWERSLKI